MIFGIHLDFDVCFEVSKKHFRTHFIIIGRKKAYVVFLLGWGIGPSIYQYTQKLRKYFFADALKEYQPHLKPRIHFEKEV
jgi:hypothetical protein